MEINLKELSTPQLREIRKIIINGLVCNAENTTNNVEESAKDYLCHKSPPKGYPSDKDQYGDPECYRYPLNTKSRALAAWRYVHQDKNKAILGNKFNKIAAKIKSYAKSKYNLDLQASESEDWEAVFVEYYDAETIGDGFVLEDNEVGIMEDKEKIEALEKDLSDTKGSLESKDSELSDLKIKIADLESKASSLDDLTKEIESIKKQNNDLVVYWFDKEIEAARGELLKARKVKIEEAGLEIDVDSEIDNWINMSDDMFEFTIKKLSDVKNTSVASKKVDVPAIVSDGSRDVKRIVREALAEHRGGK